MPLVYNKLSTETEQLMKLGKKNHVKKREQFLCVETRNYIDKTNSGIFISIVFITYLRCRCRFNISEMVRIRLKYTLCKIRNKNTAKCIERNNKSYDKQTNICCHIKGIG